MGLFHAGEKRSKDFEGKTKRLHVWRLGWKRILKNTEKFGWSFIDEDDIKEVHYYPGTNKRCYFTVWLDFLRLDSIYDLCPELKKTERIYNLFFLLRRIFVALMPIFVLAMLVTAMSMNTTVSPVIFMLLFILSFIGWIVSIILENVYAKIADKQLNGERIEKKRAKTDAWLEPSDDETITLKSANGEEIEFEEVAGIAYKGKFYAVLQPVELLEGMDEDEALVFRVTRDKNGEDKFEVELDDKIIDGVFKEYNRLLDEAERSQ